MLRKIPHIRHILGFLRLAALFRDVKFGRAWRPADEEDEGEDFAEEAQAAQSEAAADGKQDEKEEAAWHKALKTARSPAMR